MKLLLVHSSPSAPRWVSQMLAEADASGVDLTHVRRVSEGLRRLRHESFDAALVDPGPADSRGLEILRRVQESMSQVPVVLFGARWSDEAPRTPNRAESALLVESIRRAIERKQIEDRVAHLAYHDALTNLPNRLLLLDRLTQDMARAQRTNTLLAVLFLDLNGFKQINDTYGHAAGDRLLQAIAQRFLGHVRATDTVARVGGDEFIVVLPELSSVADAKHIAKKLASAIAMPIELAGETFEVTASVGMSTYPRDGTTPEALLMKADRAMYRVKPQDTTRLRIAS